MVESDTKSGRVWVSPIKGPTIERRPNPRIEISTHERLDLDKGQCCQSVVLVLDLGEAREVAEKVLEWVTEMECGVALPKSAKGGAE